MAVRDSIVMHQVVGALLAPSATEDAKEIETISLVSGCCRSKVYVVVDPMSKIVEGGENNNIMAVSEPESQVHSWMLLADGGKTALPFMIILLTMCVTRGYTLLVRLEGKKLTSESWE